MPPNPLLSGPIAPRVAQGLAIMLRTLLFAFPLMILVSALYLTWIDTAVMCAFLLVILALRTALARGHLFLACYGLIAALLLFGVAGVTAYGSIRGAANLAFVAAVIVAGIFVDRRGLAATVATGSACIGILIYAEHAQWIGRSSYAAGPATWALFTLALAAIAVSLFQARSATVGAVRRLRASEESMATFFQTSPAALIVSTRRDGRIIDINEAYERIFAARRDDVVGHTVLELGLWASAPDRERFLAAMDRDGQVSNFRARFARSDGTPFDALLSAKVIEGETEPLLLGVVADISGEVAAKETLRRSEQRFRQLFEFSPVGTLITRVSDGVYLDANRADEKTLGYTREELLGRTVLEVGAWDSDASRQKFIAKLRADKGVYGYETRMRSKAGETVDCLISARLVELDGEECVLSTVVNVTEQKRAAEREHQLRGKFEALFETSPEGIAVMRIRDTVLIDVNDAALAQFGIPREQAVGQSILTLGLGASPADNAEIFARLRAEGRVVNRPTLFRNFQGAWLDFLLSAVVIKVEGRSCVVWSWRDVTAQRQAEKTLRESEERFRGLTDFFASFAWELDDQLRFTLIRGRGLRDLGLDEADVIGRTTPQLAGGPHGIEPMNMTWDEFNALRAQRLPYRDMRISFRMASGEVRYLSLWGEPMFDAGGAFKGYRGITQDITERIRLESEIKRLNETLERRVADRTAELEAANRELESFSYSVSHDLRAPLRAIAGFSAVLREDIGRDLPPQAQRYFQRIEQNAEQMRRLIDDLLGLARAGRTSLTRAKVDMRALAGDVVRELTHENPGAARVSIGTVPEAIGDAVLLRQVWHNLVANALKFTRHTPAAEIEIGSETVDGATWYSVRDNGAGFDMAYADKLFGTFQRLHTEAEFEGSGVGLAIVKRIVDRHGGRVRAESGPGGGAKFSFSLGTG